MERERDVIHEALGRFKALAEALKPDGLAYMTQHMEILAETLESDLEWDRLLATPESQAYLAEPEREAREAAALGDTKEGGWTRS